MYQHELLFQPRSATSQAAAEQIQSVSAIQREAVYRAIAAAGAAGSTDEETATATDIDGNSVRPRRGELEKEGRIYNSGLKRPTRSGRAAFVWLATETFLGNEQ